MALTAYARVSTEGQTLEAQVAQFKAAGAQKMFKEKVSGAGLTTLSLRRRSLPSGLMTCSSSPGSTVWSARHAISSTSLTGSPRRGLGSGR